MKFALVFLVSTMAATSAFAEAKTTCLDAKLSFNSHQSIECPQATQICVKKYDEANKTAKSLMLVNERQKTLDLPFDEYYKEHDSDIASHVGLSFYENGQYAQLEIESDNWYPYPTVTGTFINLTLHTGKKSNDNSVYSSQVCSYDIIKK